MSQKKTALLTDPIYLEHDTGQHPECAERLRSIIKKLKNSNIWQQLTILPAQKADFQTVELIHDSSYIKFLEQEICSGVSYIGTPDCMVSSQTFEVALHAVGGAVSLIDKVFDGEVVNGFGLLRPPGHHAEKNQALGFCYFNNIAICAEHLIRNRGLKKILIVDFDVHHGNGTQHSFESRNDVFYCSIHQDPRTCYPGTGYREEQGKEEGKGYTLNFPMPPYSEDHDYIEVLEREFLPQWEDFNPDFVLISAGFDAHIDDPLAQINITEKTFDEYTETLCSLAKNCCNNRLVSFLEGGYNINIIPSLAQSHLEILLKYSQLTH